MTVGWEEPPGFDAVIEANVRRVLEAIASAVPARLAPTIDLARGWHRDLYEGIPRPVDYYAGEIRDSDERFPELIGYEVEVGGAPGAPSAIVPAALERFEGAAVAAVAALDASIAPSSVESATLTSVQLHGVLTLCAFLHGEWVRIHPFANGNGRTARLWANWAALRYGLPPFVTVKPRPGDPYGACGMASMRGDHRVAVAVFHQMLLDLLAEL